MAVVARLVAASGCDGRHRLLCLYVFQSVGPVGFSGITSVRRLRHGSCTGSRSPRDDAFCAIVGGAFLLFNPFTLGVMSVIAGCFMLLYGVSELISTWKVGRAMNKKMTSDPQS